MLVQIQLILTDVIGQYHVYTGNEFGSVDCNNDGWDILIDTLVRETGERSLKTSKNSKASCLQILEPTVDLDSQLNLIDLAFRYVGKVLNGRPDHELKLHGAAIKSEPAIKELNYRLREGGVGFQFENDQLIRIDSQYLHAEIVKSAINLLNRPGFKGPEEEFMAAHAQYRIGEHREAIASAGNALESTMKAICDAKKWSYDNSARISDLLKVLKSKGLFPDYLDTSFNQLISVLKSGLPEIRNNSASHGSGSIPLQIPAHFAAFAIHLAATKIVFLVECAEMKK